MNTYIENCEGYMFDNGIPTQSERTGEFWGRMAGVLGVQEEKYSRPGNLDWQLDAVRRRDARIAAANAPPTPLQTIVGDVADEVREIAAKVAKVTKTQHAVQWLSEVLRDGPVAQKEIELRAKNDGIGTKPLKLAKGKLKVQSTRKGRAAWAWMLPFAKAKEGQDA